MYPNQLLPPSNPMGSGLTKRRTPGWLAWPLILADAHRFQRVFVVHVDGIRVERKLVDSKDTPQH